jgi:hypothetical protein
MMKKKRKRKLKTVTIPDAGSSAVCAARLAFAPRLSRILLIGLLVVGSCLCATAASRPEQGPGKPYALIFGTVWGPDNRPLYGVKVKLRRDGDKKPKWEQYSDHRGEFAFRVPAGKATYFVSPDLKGYKLPDGSKLQPGDDVTVQIENDERSDIGLHLK